MVRLSKITSMILEIVGEISKTICFYLSLLVRQTHVYYVQTMFMFCLVCVTYNHCRMNADLQYGGLGMRGVRLPVILGTKLGCLLLYFIVHDRIEFENSILKMNVTISIPTTRVILKAYILVLIKKKNQTIKNN